MALYEYRCGAGHCREHCFTDGEPPSVIDPCGEDCPNAAVRIFSAPHMGLMGYRTKTARRRRSNPGDDLHTPYDREAAKIARSI